MLCNACGARWLTKKNLTGYRPQTRPAFPENQSQPQQMQAPASAPSADASDAFFAWPAGAKRKRSHQLSSSAAR